MKINEVINEGIAGLLAQADAGTWTIMENTGGVEVRQSALFNNTYSNKISLFPGIESKLSEFLKFKKENPTKPWGGSDTPFNSMGPIARAVPGIRHAHLTRDLSVLYKIEGKNPMLIKLYGVFAHSETGTGTPGNIKKQKNVAQTLGNQNI